MTFLMWSVSLCALLLAFQFECLVYNPVELVPTLDRLIAKLDLSYLHSSFARTHHFCSPFQFVYAVKSTVDTNHKYLTLSLYVALLSSWAYCRLYTLPFFISVVRFAPELVPSHSLESGHFSHLLNYAFVGMLWILFTLHVYWYALFLKMGFSFLKTGKTADTQQRVDRFDANAASAKATAEPSSKTNVPASKSQVATVTDSAVVQRRSKSRRE